MFCVAGEQSLDRVRSKTAGTGGRCDTHLEWPILDASASRAMRQEPIDEWNRALLRHEVAVA